MSSSNNGSYEMVENFYKFYGGVLVFGGIPANLLSGFIMGTDQSNRTTTRILMVLLALTDTLVLLTGVLRYWVMEIFDGFDFRNFGSFSCKFHTYIMSVSSDYAVGALCSLAVERFLVVAFPHKANEVVTINSVIYGMGGLLIGVALKNSVNFWFKDFQHVSIPGFNLSLINKNETVFEPFRYACIVPDDMKDKVKMFSKFDYITYAVFPYCILFSCNVYIFAVLRKQSRLLTANRQAAGIKMQHQSRQKLQSSRRKRKPENVIKVLTALTVIHVITTLPATTLVLINTYFEIGKDFTKEEKNRFNIIRTGLILLMFTNNATTFFAYLKSSTAFRRRLYKIFCGCKKEPEGRKSVVAAESDKETTRQMEPLTAPKRPTAIAIAAAIIVLEPADTATTPQPNLTNTAIQVQQNGAAKSDFV